MPDIYKNVYDATLGRKQRQRYNEQCAAAKESMTDDHSSVMHYSFDYAQQVHYPQEPGPIFIKTAQKCGIFGISCKPTSSQVNYMIDEADDIGKGANTTISLLHHYLQTHGGPFKCLYRKSVLDTTSDTFG